MISKQQATENNIIAVGIRMINEKGFSAVKIESICKAAGIGRSTFYHYFNGKEELVDAYFRSIVSYSPARMAWIFSTPHPAIRILRTHLSLLSDITNCQTVGIYSLQLKFFLNESGESNLYSADEFRNLLIPNIREAQEKGEILNLSDPEELCNSAITMHWGNIYLWCVSNGAFNRRERLRSNLENLYNVKTELRSLDELEECPSGD